MATLSILKLSNGLALSRCFGQQLAAKMAPASAAALVPRKTLMLSQVNRKRLYGPEEEHEKHDDVHHWKNERYVAVALLPLIPTAMLFPHPVLDTALCTAMVLHCHWRLSGVAQDYIHGEVLPRIAQPLVLILSICAFGSLCYLNYNDVGFAHAVRLLYSSL